MLELDWSQLHYITSRAVHRYSYVSFRIPKKGGGQRVIQAPHPSVRILQRKLLTILETLYQAHPAAHGFVAKRSAHTNAGMHVGKRLVLNLDLKDFFPSITFPRVRGLFIRRFNLPPAVATVLARLCCNTGDQPDHIAQGAPTSPIISNMICHSLDHELVRLAKSHGLFYTRYVDDITFSTNRRTLPLSIAVVQDDRVTALGSSLLDALDRHHFSVNDHKVRLGARGGRQSVTGLTVNERVNLPRSFPRQVRSMLHAWHAHGHTLAQSKFHNDFDWRGEAPEFRMMVAGKLSYLRQIRGRDDRLFRKLYGWAQLLEPAFFPDLPDIAVSTASLREAANEFPSISQTDPTPLRRQYFRRLVASAKGTLWLVDPNLRIDTVRQVRAAVDSGRVSEIRLLSRDRPPGNQPAEFLNIRTALLADGVSAEWRVIAGDLFHDRWIVDSTDSIAIGGPFANIFRSNPPFGQNRLVPRPAQIDTWWNRATPFYAP